MSDDGRLHEIVEVGSAGAVFEFTGRGEGCGSSWLWVRWLPGYADRSAGPPSRLVLPVPTCEATRADGRRVSFDGGVIFLDRTEATGEHWAVYARASRLTGDRRIVVPPVFEAHGRAGLPLFGVDAFVAERVCRFFGRRLPVGPEWNAAAQRHPVVTGRHVDAGCAANLEGDADGFDAHAPVGACGGDVTEDGIFDLLGNVSEWLGDSDRADELHTGLRRKFGADWSTPAGAPPARLLFDNVVAPERTDYAIGVRCALSE